MTDELERTTGIRLIVGLGNVGAEYGATRHNAGYWLVDAVARRAGARFSSERKFHGDVARLRIAGHDVWLLKPTTYVNRSGQSVVALALFYRILPTEILVVHDELDLAPGVVKLKRGGGTAGHNGLKDTQARLQPQTSGGCGSASGIRANCSSIRTSPTSCCIRRAATSRR